MKTAPPIDDDPGGFRDFRILCFSEHVDFGNFPVGFGVWEGLQSIGNGCRLPINGFSAHFESYGFIFEDFHDLSDFTIVSDGLPLFPEGPRTFPECPEGPGTP